MINYADELPVKNWAKTLAYDYEIGEELFYSNITSAFPKKVISVNDWTIERITVYKTKVQSIYAMTFYVKAVEGDNVYTQKIRIYNPYLPRTRSIDEYIGCKIVGANMICSVRHKQVINVARFVQIIKKDGRKSNPIMRLEEETLDSINKQQWAETPDFVDYGSMSEKEFLSTYFPEREKEKFII